jgi:hypothetical protein
MKQTRKSQVEVVKEERFKNEIMVGQVEKLVDNTYGVKTRFGRI